MAQAECVKPLDLVDKKEKTMEATATDSPSNKKLKQGRLPFKPLDTKAKGGNIAPASKKRKLSDVESPSAKLAKTLQPVTPKSLSVDGEHEVSSSSEAEKNAQQTNTKPPVKMNTLDKFFKKPEDHEEISSTNDCVTIDLTDEAMECQSENSEGTSPNKSDGSGKDQAIDLKEESTTVDADDSVKVGPSVEGNEEKKLLDESENEVEKENLDSSFITDPMVLEKALKTPLKENEKTVTPKRKKPSTGSPVSQTESAASDATPSNSIKKRSSLSDSNKKERDLSRHKIKEEKEKEREEKRVQKEKERLDKDKERLEKKKQRDDEKAEKEKQKQDEKEKREKERLEKLQQKEEEKKKKEEQLEAKTEEKKKKEEERKQKEEERKQKEEEKKKEEEEKNKKQKKLKESFKGFFIKQAPTNSPPKVYQGNSLFKPFEMKPNMKLAPRHRGEVLQNTEEIDDHLQNQNCENLYVAELQSKVIKPKTDEKTYPRELEDHDVELLAHDTETIKKVTHKVKLLQFHENHRPPYYGTWSKPTSVLTPRNPYKQDEALFDYELDSDDEWEEEEPGESVSSDENDDEKDEEKDDDDDEDGWMVPHGHLSEDEGINDEEDEVSPEMMKLKQHQAQLAWENELRQRTQPMKQTVIGCHWTEQTTAIAAQQLQKLLSFKAVCLVEGPIPTGFTRSDVTEKEKQTGTDGENPSTQSKGVKPKSVPEEAIPDLIRLIHGNTSGIKVLVREFRGYWRLKTTGKGATSPGPGNEGKKDDGKGEKSPPKVKDNGNKSESTSQETPGSMAEDSNHFSISKRQLEIKIMSIAARLKKGEAKMCWYVNDDVLKQYNMEDIKLPNTWDYVIVEKRVPVTPKAEVSVAERGTPKIMQFAQPMTLSQIQAAGVTSIAKDTTVQPKETNTETSVSTKILVEAEIHAEMVEKPNKLASDQKSIFDFIKTGQNSAKKMEQKSNPGKRKSEPVDTSNKESVKSTTQSGTSVGAVKKTPDSTTVIILDEASSPKQPKTSIKRITPIMIDKNGSPLTKQQSSQSKPSTVKLTSQSVLNHLSPGVKRVLPIPVKPLSENNINSGSNQSKQNQPNCGIDSQSQVQTSAQPMEEDVIVLD